MPDAKTSPPRGQMLDVEEAAAAIRTGGFFSVAGDAALLRRLPKGNWIGGTIPYFMARDGGQTNRDKVFVDAVEIFGLKPWIATYDVTSLSRVCLDAPANGYSIIVIPAFSDVHSFFARRAPEFEDMYAKPLIGWIAGIHLADIGKAHAEVVNGQTGAFGEDRAVVLHVPLPADRYARIDIVNRMKQGKGAVIRFAETGFSATQCMVDGQPANLARYLTEIGADPQFPLVADYCGAMVNVSIKHIDLEAGRVDFYAPVFEHVEYRLAERDETVPAMPEGGGTAAFCCNCILNYLNDKLEGRRVGDFTGPVTFGEIAYQLLNQTLVYLTIEQA